MKIYLTQRQNEKEVFLQTSAFPTKEAVQKAYEPTEENPTPQGLHWVENDNRTESIDTSTDIHAVQKAIEKATGQETFILLYHKGQRASVAFNAPSNEFVILSRAGIDTAPTFTEAVAEFKKQAEA